MDIRDWLKVLALGFAVGITVYVLNRTTSRFGPYERLGPPALIESGDAPVLWVMCAREEQRQAQRSINRLPTGGPIAERYYHFELHEFDPLTSRLKRKWTLLTLHENEGGRSARARILGQDEEVVWLFLRNQLLAVSSHDGSVLADQARLEQINPELRGLMPNALPCCAYVDGLVISTADAHHYLISPPKFLALPYTPSDDELFRRARFIASAWNGGYHTADFLVRQGMIGGRWVGLYSEAEAADAENDSFGEKLRNPSSVLNEGSGSRRALQTAQIGQTRVFSEGSHDRLMNLRRVKSSPDFLEGGLLVRAGMREPLALARPEGFLVLHRTRTDAQGRLALTRLDKNFQSVWETELPLTELTNRWEVGNQLLLFGSAPSGTSGESELHEYLVALDVRSGAARSWDIREGKAAR